MKKNSKIQKKIRVFRKKNGRVENHALKKLENQIQNFKFKYEDE